jgi:malonyl-CoA/methylmalonyl-CoA synthetase
MIQLFAQAQIHQQRIAVRVGVQDYTYGQLLATSQGLAVQLLGTLAHLNGARIGYMVGPGFEYIACQWAIWQAGGVAVPLCISHPLPAISYTLANSQTSTVIYTTEYESLLKPLFENNKISFVNYHSLTNGPYQSTQLLPIIDPQQPAMILYTSGTTSQPKGVVTSHANIEAQICSLVNAWHWTPTDHILCVLPLHHVHGIIAVIGCAMWAGAICEFQPKFSAQGILNAFGREQITLFMAVPTIYFKLIAALEQLPKKEQLSLKNSMSKLRLMVSGSAALPVSVMQQWQVLSGHVLLERYGMTELGMAISNPYQGARKAGYIGQALQQVQVRLANEQDQEIQNQPGEIQVKGPNVFLEYYHNPEATAKAFTADGWFKTGDIAVLEEGYYRILGRDSVDIIKSGGYKISALEIEELLRQHPAVADCSVVGLANTEWGEIVAAALVPTTPNQIDTNQINTWLRQQLPAYKCPRQYLVLLDLPRNAMGKVTKNDLKPLFSTN